MRLKHTLSYEQSVINAISFFFELKRRLTIPFLLFNSRIIFAQKSNWNILTGLPKNYGE
jgi:hypothetical protein